MARSDREGARRVALVGVLSAGGLALLWCACLAPTGRTGLTAVAGFFPVAAVLVGGRGAGFLCWGVISLLGLLLMPNKELAILFAVFLGLYPVVKSRLEQCRLRPVEWLCKLVYFNGAFFLFYFGLQALLFSGLPHWLSQQVPLLVLAANGVFVVYDIGLSKAIALITARLRTARRR